MKSTIHGRLLLFMSIMLSAFVLSAWVIKDTANPVDIYTGSNTTPTISGATSGAVTLGPTGFAGTHSINGGVTLTTPLPIASGGTGSSTGIESGTFSASFTGARSMNLTISYYRAAGLVTLRFPQSIGVSCAAAIFSASAATIPSTLRPSANIGFFALVQSGSQTYGNVAINSDGSMNIYKAAGNSAFDAANCGIYHSSFSYPTN